MTSVTEEVNTIYMNRHLRHLFRIFSGDHIALIIGYTSSHRGKNLELPDNILIDNLPPYSPELTPTEQTRPILENNIL
jgi:transposase